MNASILLVGSKRGRHKTYLATLQKHFTVHSAPSGKQALELARQSMVSAIVVDAVSLRSTGDRLCRTLKNALPNVPLVHIHPGPRDRAKSPAEVVLFMPLSARRLANSVGALVHNDGEEVIACGPFTMNIPRRILAAYGQETQLTPKAAQLMETFMRQPGQTIDRKTLMARVWETDYLGDTRTLDVHVRWLRKVMERGGKPRYLETVRGVGYRLAPPDAAANSQHPQTKKADH